MTEVIVIGAGPAGLAAAEELSRAGIEVEVLEASARTGGRILTIASEDFSGPIELGAEFVHGSKNSVWTLIREASLTTREAQSKPWTFSGGRLRSTDMLYQRLQECFEQIDLKAPDVSFDQFLKHRKIPNEWFVRRFVEGFDAADTTIISSHSLAKAELSDAGGEDMDFRISGGYKMLVRRLQARAEKHGARFHLGTIVQQVNWRPGKVEIVAQTRAGRRIFSAPQAVVTLPLGVLQDAKLIQFAPVLESKEPALAGLEMGSIVKVIFEFTECFWQKRMRSGDFGFLHDKEGTFRTWWSADAGPLLTGWIGGPAAKRLAREKILPSALADLGRIFRMTRAQIRTHLRRWHFHDWSADPFFQGAYSFTRVGNIKAAQQLAEPISNTLFFAGEATRQAQEQGTVHGAISSGGRAAREILTGVESRSVN